MHSTYNIMNHVQCTTAGMSFPNKVSKRSEKFLNGKKDVHVAIFLRQYEGYRVRVQ